MFKNNPKLLILSLFTATVLLLSACGSDHDHGPTPAGLEILVNGEVVAVQDGTQITYPGDNDSILLNEGDEIVATVQFILESGEPYNYTVEDGYELTYNIGNAEVINIDHPHNTDHWSMMINALSAGSSSLNFELWHVDHSDFDSRNFTITVQSSAQE